VFGRYLEIALPTRDIVASATFYERLGFQGLSTGDVYAHRYGVYSDGRLHLGLHERDAPGAALVAVAPSLRARLARLEAAGFRPGALHLGDEDFHSIELADPAGMRALLLEARTYSPPAAPCTTRCGRFAHWSLPARDPPATAGWWERAGWVALPESAAPYPHVPLVGDDINLALHAPHWLTEPCLVFIDEGMAARIASLRADGLRDARALPPGIDATRGALLRAPEGTLLLLCEE